MACFPQLPVELPLKNRAASTNRQDSIHLCHFSLTAPKIGRMSPETQIELIAERVERLLRRHEELMQHHAALKQELEQMRQQRDAFAQRLTHATERLDALLAQLPPHPGDPA